MAKKRYINTKFWDDPFVGTLQPNDKLVFLYIITNPLTDICGIYEIEYRRISYDTGLSVDIVEQAIHRLSEAGKVYYIEGWIFVTNFYKHQAVNESVQKGVIRSLNDVPINILTKISEINTECYRLCTGWVQTATNLDLDLHLNLNFMADESAEKSKSLKDTTMGSIRLEDDNIVYEDEHTKPIKQVNRKKLQIRIYTLFVERRGITGTINMYLRDIKELIDLSIKVLEADSIKVNDENIYRVICIRFDKAVNEFEKLDNWGMKAMIRNFNNLLK